jgi:hypothetical protein
MMSLACCHPSRNEVLLFMPRDRAGALRRRLLTDARFGDVTVSPLYRVGSGWAVTVCAECQVAARKRPQTERRARMVGMA